MYILNVVANKQTKESSSFKSWLKPVSNNSSTNINKLSRSNSTISYNHPVSSDDIYAASTRPIAYLKVLQALVFTYPREMIEVMKAGDTQRILYKIIIAQSIPATVRQTLLSMVANWCVLYEKHWEAKNNLEGVVDLVYQDTKMKPHGATLPMPSVFRKQEGWVYPKSRSQGDTRLHHQQQREISPVQHSANYHFQQPYTYGRPSVDNLVTDPTQTYPPSGTKYSAGPTHLPTFARNNTITNNEDPVVLSQYRELRRSNNPFEKSPRHSNNGGGNELSDEFVAHMETSVKELQALCDMLTDTLSSLDVWEDPSKNSVVIDTAKDIKDRKDSLHNFLGLAASERHEVLFKRITAMTDVVDRTLDLYGKAVDSHNEWKGIQESLRTSAAEDQRMFQDTMAASSDSNDGNEYPKVTSTVSPSSYSNLAKEARVYEPESSNSAAKLYAAAGDNSDTDNSSLYMETSETAPHSDQGHQQGRPLTDLQRMSSKAKGKRAADPADTEYSEWDPEHVGVDFSR